MAVFVRNPDTIWTNLNEKIVIMGIASNRYFEVAGVGQDIWNLLEQPRSLSQLIDSIVAEYDVEAAQCEKDVQGFLASLLAAQLIRELD